MTRSRIQEYAEVMRKRYRDATKAAKAGLLDEFTQVTGLHRKAAIRLLNRRIELEEREPRGRKKEYGLKERDVLKVLWEASDRLCSKRLEPFLPELLKVMRRHGEIVIDAALEAKLCRMSSSTIDRLLRSSRGKGGSRGLTTTKPGNLLKN